MTNHSSLFSLTTSKPYSSRLLPCQLPALTLCQPVLQVRVLLRSALFPGREQPPGVLEDKERPGERRELLQTPHWRFPAWGLLFLPGFSDEQVIHGGNSPGPFKVAKTQDEFLSEEGSCCLTILLCLLSVTAPIPAGQDLVGCFKLQPGCLGCSSFLSSLPC